MYITKMNKKCKQQVFLTTAFASAAVNIKNA